MTEYDKIPTPLEVSISQPTNDWFEWSGWDDNSFFEFETPKEISTITQIDYDSLEDIDENNIWLYYNNAATEENRKYNYIKAILYIKIFFLYKVIYITQKKWYNK